MRYSSGSVAALSGRLVVHNVTDCHEQRLAYAYTMKDTVHHAAGVKAAPWMESELYGLDEYAETRQPEGDIYA